ncbi:hypothetical protein C7974DRAFT_443732 [Boeremia exigua]|uniref:uncharacterized protein n=1 Tax=Boeremia exigua TaxID=749465 RepID=UPI001E8EC31D|nr:uncharacterized protein C7974DRAFT_443732 [Boeremia exigua]KAH6613847.1 hypothetical protein C7974DRAFT_443732 [Boeremia exigua]
MADSSNAPRRVSMAFILGFSNKPFKDGGPPAPTQPPPPRRPSAFKKMVTTPGGAIEWVASDGRRGRLTGPGKPRVSTANPTTTNQDNTAAKKDADDDAGGMGMFGLFDDAPAATQTEKKAADADSGWTDEEDKKLLELRSENPGPWIDTANAMGMPGQDQKCRARFNKIKPPGWKPNKAKGGNQKPKNEKNRNNQHNAQNLTQPATVTNWNTGGGTTDNKDTTQNANNGWPEIPALADENSWEKNGATGDWDKSNNDATGDWDKSNNATTPVDTNPATADGIWGGWGGQAADTGADNKPEGDAVEGFQDAQATWETGVDSGDKGTNAWDDTNKGSEETGFKETNGWGTTPVTGEIGGNTTGGWDTTEGAQGGAGVGFSGEADTWANAAPTLDSTDKKIDGGNTTTNWDTTGNNKKDDVNTTTNWDTTKNNDTSNNTTNWPKNQTTAANNTSSHNKSSKHHSRNNSSKDPSKDPSKSAPPTSYELTPDQTFSAADLRLIARILQQDCQLVWDRVSWRFRDKTGRNLLPSVFEEKITGRVVGEDRGGGRR